MSYFDFINQSSPKQQEQHSETTLSSIVLPVSIADELYESQTLNIGASEPEPSTFCRNTENQPTVAISSQRRGNSISSSTSQDYSNARQGPSPSVFGFINQSIKRDSMQSVDDLVFALKQPEKSPTAIEHRTPPQHEIDTISSTQPASSTNRKTLEMQRLYEESNWKRTKAGRQHQQELIQQLYEQRKAVIAEIQSSQALLQSNSEEKQQAKDDEDYDKLDKLIKQQQFLKAKLDRLKYDVWDTTTQQIHSAWMKMSALIRTEGECASKVAHTHQETKDERQQQFTQYNLDMKRKHDNLLKEINAARSDIESGKSQLAFDLDFWKQAKAELDEKMAEATHEKTLQKNELMAKVDSTDEEITTIKKKLAELTQKRQTYVLEINNLEHDIGQTLLPYQSQVKAQDMEQHQINARKNDLEQQSNDLDQRDARLQQKIEHCRQYEDQKWKELNDMDDAIRQATGESLKNASDADVIMTVLNQCLFDRDRAIREMAEKQRKVQDDIKQLRNQVEQQQNDYNSIQQQMDDDDTRLNLLKMQKMKMARKKSRAVEHEQYEQAAKWQEQIRQIDLRSDQDLKTLTDNQAKLDSLDLDLKTTQEQLHRLLMKSDAQEHDSVEATIGLLNDSENTLTRLNETSWILENELDSIRHWKSYLIQYLDGF